MVSNGKPHGKLAKSQADTALSVQPTAQSPAAQSPGAKLVLEALDELNRRKRDIDKSNEIDADHLDQLRNASTLPSKGSQHVRRTPRRPFQRPVGVLVGGHYEVLRARQLSEGGMSIFLGNFGSRLRIKVEEVKIGQKIGLTFVLPSGHHLSLLGEVIYHDAESGAGLHIGIKFGVVPLHQRRLIRAYVSSKKSGESADVQSMS